jgi:hypothetical protein
MSNGIFSHTHKGMLTPHEIHNDGTLLAILQLADYKYTPFHNASETQEKEDIQQLLDREQMIQSVAAKGISAICATGAYTLSLEAGFNELQLMTHCMVSFLSSIQSASYF